jgi:uncharacterized protein (TIGR02001 family)
MYRGLSLSDDNPVPQASIAYDSPTGWYLGAFASRIAIHGDPTHTQLIGYGGYAQQWSSDVSWEAGTSKIAYLQDAQSDYAEFFGGLASEHFSGRVYYSPNYLGQGLSSLYAELNANYSPQEHLHLLAHLGHLHVSPSAEATVASHFDCSVGIKMTLGEWNAQLALVAAQLKKPTYLQRYADTVSEQNSRTGVITVSYSF